MRVRNRSIPVFVVLGVLASLALTRPGWWFGRGAEAAGDKPLEVVLKDNLFEPSRVRVQPGATIIFRNLGKQLHAVTLIGHEAILDQGFIDPQKSLTFVVPKDMSPGEYTLGCNIHVDMKGTLVVEAAS